MTVFPRYERKYLIPQHMRARISEFLKPYMLPDTNSPQAYKVTSLYFDNKDFDSYWDSVDGSEQRQKYRIRYYDHLKDHFFLEVKAKNGIKSKKYRRLFTTNPIPYFSRSSKSSDSYESEFTSCYYKNNLAPVLWVQYTRSALNSQHPLDGVRITFDENVRYSPYKFDENPQFLENHSIYKDKIIMEIKTHLHPPYWVQMFINSLENNKASISKYVLACRKIKSQRY